MNSDTISRQAVLNATSTTLRITGKENAETVYGYIKKLCDDIKALPPIQPDVIRCKDCKWWDKYSNTRGYCLAAKHGYWSEHWDISIRRTYDANWYCADAERREQKLQYADEETAQCGLMSAT